MNLSHLSTSTPASEISSASFRDDMGNSAELEAPNFDDILRNSPAAALLGIKKEESLPTEDEDVLTPEQSEEDETTEEVQEETSDDAENDSDEESDQEVTEEESADEDDTSTQDSELPTEEDIDWEYKVPVTVDGKTEYLSLEELRKGFATDKHLSQKGRELGELKKQIEEERDQKLDEVVKVGTMVRSELMQAEDALAQEYNKIKSDISKARDEGDTYTARDLKEKLEDVQEKYWKARTKREDGEKLVAEQIVKQQREVQQKLLKEFQEKIPTFVPDFNEKVAKSIRSFAVQEGIPEAMLDQVYSPEIVKFINDYRKLKETTTKGAVKRKAVPTSRSVPTKKGTPQSVQQKRVVDESRAKVLSGNGSDRDQLDFLKRISSVSKKLQT